MDDGAERAALFQRYTGQIQARIERAWMRPRTGFEAGLFNCRVQIVQDRHGNVVETTLQRCNGAPAWQGSLVQAIQTASPLPAPPDPEVFADALTLEFTSAQYQAGGDEEGFEPERRLAQASAMPVALEPWLHGVPLIDRHGNEPSGVELNIHGAASDPSVDNGHVFAPSP